MEHRYSERVTTAINAVIVRHGVPVAMGRIRDCSKTGFFIETDYHEVGLLQHLDIELQHRAPSDTQKTKRLRYRTVVVRRSPGGLGLEIEASRTKSASQVLRAILDDGRYGPSERREVDSDVGRAGLRPHQA